MGRKYSEQRVTWDTKQGKRLKGRRLQGRGTRVGRVGDEGEEDFINTMFESIIFNLEC